MRLRLLGFLPAIGLLGSTLLFAQQQDPSNRRQFRRPSTSAEPVRRRTKIITTVVVTSSSRSLIAAKACPSPKSRIKVLTTTPLRTSRYFSRQSDLPCASACC
jgi:hypothetical protein